MKLSDLHEMTMRAGLMGHHLNTFFKNVLRHRDEYQHVGDIEDFQVLFNKQDNIYLLVRGETGVGFFQVFNWEDTAALEVAYVDAPYRKQQVFTKFLWFLKRNEGYGKIQIGDVHSQDTIEALKRISHRFNIYWTDGKTKQPYSPDTIDQFYGTQHPTEWRIVLENGGDFSKWPKFFNIVDIHTHYDWILTNK